MLRCTLCKGWFRTARHMPLRSLTHHLKNSDVHKKQKPTTEDAQRFVTSVQAQVQQAGTKAGAAVCGMLGVPDGFHSSCAEAVGSKGSIQQRPNIASRQQEHADRGCADRALLRPLHDGCPS